jgi:hypothetical protein
MNWQSERARDGDNRGSAQISDEPEAKVSASEDDDDQTVTAAHIADIPRPEAIIFGKSFVHLA